MKKFALVLVLALLFAMVGCTAKVQPFSPAMGEQAWRQEGEPTAFVSAGSAVVLPAGYTFEADWGEMGFLLSRLVDSSPVYGVWQKDGWVMDCRYVNVVCSGRYYMAAHYSENVLYHEVFDQKGNLIVGTVESGSLYDLGEGYFVLYGKKQAQIFDADARSYFSDNQFGLSHTFALCGNYLLSYNTEDYSCCIWQMMVDNQGKGMAILLHAPFAQKGLRYTPVFTGKKFLITALSEATAADYTYFEILDSTTYYVRQQAWWFNPDTGELTQTDLGFVLLGARNRYTPGISREEKNAIALCDGYTAVSVGVLNNKGLKEYSRYYVMDANGNLVLAYPSDVNPSALHYCADVGYVTANLHPAVLYGLDGNMLWQNKQHDYMDMHWQSNRLVACYADAQGSHYGAFDLDGNVVVPFDYNFVAPFVDGVSIARNGNDYVRVYANSLETVDDVCCSDYWLNYGCYVYADGNRYGLKNLAGAVLDTGWQELQRIGRNSNGQVYVVGQKGPDCVYMVLQ